MDRRKYFLCWILRVCACVCVCARGFFFPPLSHPSSSSEHDRNRSRERQSYSSTTSFCTQRRVNYTEASILGWTARTWGFSLCPFITFCWLARPCWLYSNWSRWENVNPCMARQQMGRGEKGDQQPLEVGIVEAADEARAAVNLQQTLDGKVIWLSKKKKKKSAALPKPRHCS